MNKAIVKFLTIFGMFLLPQLASALDLQIRKGEIVNLPRPAAHVFIANPDIADVEVRSPDYIYVYGVATGETTLHALDANNNLIYMDDVSVQPNLSGFDKALKRLLPDSDISFDYVGTGIVLKGSVNNPKEAETAVSLANSVLETGQKLVNMLEVKGSDQVMLRVRVAEVSRSEVQNFGINLGAAFTRGSFAFGLFTGRAFETTAGALVRSANGANAVRLQGSPGQFDLDSVIDALETEGLVKTLAEPNLTTKSGTAASFLAGGEFPVPVPQDGGVLSIEYREYGVRLDFTPTVLSDDKISLQVAPEVSTLTDSTVDISTINVPGLAKRRASTTVELGSGESFAIAGLLQNNTSNSIEKFPFLGELPVIGALFSSSEFQNDETELVIIVTPYIVSSVKDSDELKAPTDGLEFSSDIERIFYSQLQHIKATDNSDIDAIDDGEIAIRRLYGKPGFMLEE